MATKLLDRYILKTKDGFFDHLSGVLGQGTGKITGTVKKQDTPTNIPLRRRVRLYRDIDGYLLREVWSDAVTGAYEFNYIDELQKYTVIAYDYEHAYNAEVTDDITPAII